MRTSIPTRMTTTTASQPPERRDVPGHPGRRRRRRHPAVPVRARRPAERDRAAPGRLRPGADLAFSLGLAATITGSGSSPCSRGVPSAVSRSKGRSSASCPPSSALVILCVGVVITAQGASRRRAEPEPIHSNRSHERTNPAMFGLDDAIAHLSTGGSVLVVILVAALLGLRHATDPDHIAAVTTLVASGENARQPGGRSARRVLGPRARADARRLRPADPALPAVPAGAGAAGRRDRRGRADRLPRAPAARPLAARLLQPARPHAHEDHTIRSGRRSARSGSGSSTARAAAPASASCSSPRSRRHVARAPRSSCSRSSPRCR